MTRINKNIRINDADIVVHFNRVTRGVIFAMTPDDFGYLIITIVAPVFSRKSNIMPKMGNK